MSKLDKFYEAILKPMNACDYTGVETMQSMEVIGHYALVTYVDNVGNTRANIVLDGEVISGMLVDHTGEIARRYTKEQHRGQRLTKQMVAYMSYKYPEMNLRHSKNLTTAGSASI